MLIYLLYVYYLILCEINNQNYTTYLLVLIQLLLFTVRVSLFAYSFCFVLVFSLFVFSLILFFIFYFILFCASIFGSVYLFIYLLIYIKNKLFIYIFIKYYLSIYLYRHGAGAFSDTCVMRALRMARDFYVKTEHKSFNSIRG